MMSKKELSKEQKIKKIDKEISKLEKEYSSLQEKLNEVNSKLFNLKYEKVGIELDGKRCGCSSALCRGHLDYCYGRDW